MLETLLVRVLVEVAALVAGALLSKLLEWVASRPATRGTMDSVERVPA